MEEKPKGKPRTRSEAIGFLFFAVFMATGALVMLHIGLSFEDRVFGGCANLPAFGLAAICGYAILEVVRRWFAGEQL